MGKAEAAVFQFDGKFRPSLELGGQQKADSGLRDVADADLTRAGF
jgi:hypothetical protein